MAPGAVRTGPVMRRPGRSSARTLLTNSVSQAGGRLLLSLSRLAVAMLIVRWAGAERFGEYVVVLSFLAVAEWLVDFGQGDVAVRDISREPHGEAATLLALARLKLIQGLLLVPLLPAVLLLAGYPAPIVKAGAIASLGLPLFGGAMLFRAGFKTHLRMGRDILAELAGVAVLLPATWAACTMRLGVEGLMSAYLLGRVAFFAAGFLLSRDARHRARAPAPRATVARVWKEALPLGLIGLMVGIYDGMAPVMLSKLSTLHEVAVYAGAMRFVFPIIIIVQAVNTAFFPLLARSWPQLPARAAALQQMALDVSLLLAVGMICGLYAGADSMMALLGPDMDDGATVLRWTCIVALLRTVSTTMSPLILIGGWQSRAAWLTMTSVTLQLAGLLAVAPRYGAMGAVATCLALELVLGALSISLVGLRATRIRLSWTTPARLVACGAIAIAAGKLLGFWGTLACGVVSGLAFLAMAWFSGTISIARLRRFAEEMRERSAGIGAPPGAAK